MVASYVVTLVTWAVKVFIIFGLCPNIMILQRNFKFIILGKLFPPEFVSNQFEILTQYSQSSQVFCYDFSKTSIVFFWINPGFSGTLYSWQTAVSAYL